MLHITNGDAAADKIKACGGLDGEVLPWREMWIDGPAHGAWWEPEAAAARAEAIEADYGIPAERFGSSCARQLARLEEAVERREPIVLWFEYDLFDQTMLASLLAWLDRFGRGHAAHGGVEAIVAAADALGPGASFRGLGELTPARLLALWPSRKAVTPAELAYAAEVWRAYASRDPRALTRRLADDPPQGPASAVMAEAMRFHLRRFPSTEAGIGAAERATLERLAGGPLRPDELFRRVSDALPVYGLGDLQYWAYLRRMTCNGLIAIEGGKPLPGRADAAPDFDGWRIALTRFGAAVAAGEADAVRDGRTAARWLGGVRIGEGDKRAWRFGERGDGERGSMIFA